jgi:hypothetical protein
MEIIDIGLSDLEPISFSLNESDTGGSSGFGGGASPKPSVNFGPGIELLMNDKKKSSAFSTNVDLGELDKLENELNNLSDTSTASANTPAADTRTLSGFAANLFNFGGSSTAKSEPANQTSNSSSETTDSNLGHATVESIGTTKTWDGFAKMGEVPLGSSANVPRMSERDKRRKKRAMIKKLEDWYEKGHMKNTSHYNMDSPYDEVEDEYETVMEEKRKKDSVKLQGWWFMTAVNSIEYANAVFNPFDFNLDGWGEQVSEDIESYEEIFSELHEKYKGGKLSPELSLLLRLGFSAAVVNITNKALSTATPGFNDVIRQSPELMKMFTNATVQSMSQNNPGAGFMNNILHPEEQVKTSFGPPPAPMETKSMPPPQRPGSNVNMGNRPDISMGRGTMFREEGIDLGNNYESANRPPTRSTVPSMNDMARASTLPRPEMRGPQNLDLGGLLSGLKTREVNIHNRTPTNNGGVTVTTVDENDSMISASSMRDLQGANVPKKSNRRKQKSDRNTISLDI